MIQFDKQIRARMLMSGIRIVLSTVVTLCLMPGIISAVFAQSYPLRPIKLVVPFPAGGANDTAARLVTQGLSSRLGQPVVIENQAGAGGTIAAKQVATAVPDGHTLLMVVPTNTFGTAPVLYKLDFDPVKAFAPIGMLASDKQVMVVTPSVPVMTVQELVRFAKVNPGKLNYGSATGIAPHFLMELFKIKTATDIVHIPYRGGAPMIADLLGGQVQMTINGKSVLLPHIMQGKLRPLAVSNSARWPELPNVPTLTEGGYMDWPYETLFGIVAPAGTPVPVIDTLNRAINEALLAEDIRASFAKLGIEPKPMTPQAFAQTIAEEVPRWSEVVRVTGIKPN
jgi:tripartite-type tricarboxylate transporter receptor subunit TctC